MQAFPTASTAASNCSPSVGAIQAYMHFAALAIECLTAIFQQSCIGIPPEPQTLNPKSLNAQNPNISLPQGHDPRQGLPKLRKDWVGKRLERGDAVLTQMHYAKRGIVTEEMTYAAAREGLDPEFVRSEVRLWACLSNSPRISHLCINGNYILYAILYIKFNM